LFEEMPGARPIGIELAIGKARSAALFQEPTQTVEEAINTGRPAAITAQQMQMQGGVPIRVAGTVVGAVGVSGLDKANDVTIADAARSCGEVTGYYRSFSKAPAKFCRFATIKNNAAAEASI
jgi:uncharacterized protein GlcG (DUF336 family)